MNNIMTNRNRSFLISPDKFLPSAKMKMSTKCLKSSSGQGFGKEVSELVTCIDKFNVKKSRCNLFSDKMVVKHYMFCTSMKYRIGA